MVAKVPIRTVYTGANATGLSEYQTGEFIDYVVGGTGLVALGTANQVLATNSGATAIEWQDATTGDITGVTAGNGLSGGGSSGVVTVTINTSVTADLSTAQSLSNKTITASSFSGTQVDVTAQGDLRLQDTSGGQYVALQAPGTVSSSWTATLPAAVGSSGQALRTSDGSGTLEWFTPETGDLTGVTAGTGLSGGGTSGTVTVAIDSTVATLTGTQTLTNKSFDQVDILAQGDLRLQDTSGGQYVAFQAPGTVSTSWTATFPAAVGSSGQALRTSDGSGTLEWFTPEVGDITGVTAGAGLTGGGTSGTVTLDVVGGTGITANANDIAIDSTVTTLTGSQTLTNKTLTSPTINAATLTGAVVSSAVVTGTADFTGLVLLGPSPLVFEGAVPDGYELTLAVTDPTADRTWTIPNTTDTFTGLSSTQTLTNKTLTSPVLNGTLSGTAFLDEDTMSSNSAVAAASQQSIKSYVDATASGLDLKDSSHAATAAALSAVTYSNGSSGVGATLTANANGALTVDGQTMVADERVLVKDQAAGLQNGIYTVTATGSGSAVFVLTRTTDFDSTTEVTSGAFTFVETGTTNADSGWVLTTDGTITIGTTALAFSQFSGAGQITAGTGLSKSGNTLNVDAAQTQITSVGTIGTGTWQGTAIANAYIGSTIDATKLANGTVTNAELQYINTLSSNAQTQIDTKATKGFSIAMGVALG